MTDATKKSSRCDKLRADPAKANEVAAWQALAEDLEAALRHAEQEIRETAREMRDVAAEATWRERLGEDHGSY